VVSDPEQQRARRLSRGERRQRFGAGVAQQGLKLLARLRWRGQSRRVA
jgi:hypothetical protein